MSKDSFDAFCAAQVKRIKGVAESRCGDVEDVEEGPSNISELRVESRGIKAHATGKRKPHMDDQALLGSGAFPYSRRKETIFSGYERKWGRAPEFNPKKEEEK